jgi:hypothetical protein
MMYSACFIRQFRSMMIAIAVFGVIAAAIISGCHPANSPRGAVDRFIGAYYVEIDLKAAEPYCTGLALDKIHQEVALTAGQRIDAGTRKPTVYYKLKAERAAPDHVEYLFSATIEVPDGGSFQRNWMITARKDGDTWKVSNFSEYENGQPQ